MFLENISCQAVKFAFSSQVFEGYFLPDLIWSDQQWPPAATKDYNAHYSVQLWENGYKVYLIKK